MQIYKTLEHNIRIVEYENSLAATIADMWNKSAESWGGGTGIRTAEQIIEEHKTLTYFNVFIALDGETAVGYCSLLNSYFDANTLYIGLLGVRPDYQGKKVGKALVLECVERTIELKYPRLDIHTWSGNTKAVPLYKKCGFLWEDREDSTYLINFIPMILHTDLFSEFFQSAHWYQDATRPIDLERDGVKINKFETFGYSWERDGISLHIGFERSGRSIRMIETNDYKIEFMADSHEPAFGMYYTGTFEVENKTGVPLDISIQGKDDRNVRFSPSNEINMDSSKLTSEKTGVQSSKPSGVQSLQDPLEQSASQSNSELDGIVIQEGISVQEQLIGRKEFKGRFYVDIVNEPQNTWHIHPRVVADVTINGKTVEFGLGINTKVPVQLQRNTLREIAQIGHKNTSYFNLTSALREDAVVTLTIPPNTMTQFESDTYTTAIKADGKASIKTSELVTGIGHERVMVKYDVTFVNAKIPAFTFEYPLHLVNQNFTKQFAYETEEKYHIVNGPWAIHMEKKNNDVYAVYLKEGTDLHFGEAKLGMPFISEFLNVKPEVRMYQQDELMVCEATFASEKKQGIHLIFVYELSASGVMKRYYKVKNTSTVDQAISVLDSYWLPIRMETMMFYDGKIVRNSDSIDGGDSKWGVGDIEVSKWTENWLYEDQKEGSLAVCWSPQYHASNRWGMGLNLECDCGLIAAGEEYTTEAVELYAGIFKSYHQFRNYVMNRYDREPEHVEFPMQPKFNEGNPFVQKTQIPVELCNNRSVVRSGKIIATVDGCEQVQENPMDEVVPVNQFDLKFAQEYQEIKTLDLKLDLDYYKRSYKRALFFPDPSVTIETKVEEDRYICDNGRIHFEVGTNYSDALISLISHSAEGDQQWLFTRYPNHEPYAWSNPYIGGLHSFLSNMSGSMMIKEKVSAEFCKVMDRCGNEWQGIKTTMAITEHPDHKGITMNCYYVTMPKLPVLCQFFALTNETGHYREDEVSSDVSIEGGNRLEGLSGRFIDKKGLNYEFHYGVEENARWADHLIEIVSQKRKEHLFLYRDDSEIENDFDNTICQVNSSVYAYTEHGESVTGKPMFLIMTEEELDAKMLEDLKRVRF